MFPEWGSLIAIKIYFPLIQNFSISTFGSSRFLLNILRWYMIMFKIICVVKQNLKYNFCCQQIGSSKNKSVVKLMFVISSLIGL